MSQSASLSFHSSAPPFLRLRGLHKSFDVKARSIPVLQDINLDVAQGEFISVVGSSGCGKSTLLRLLIGLASPSAGEVCLEGLPIEGTAGDRSIVFQDHRLFPWLTVAQNIDLALSRSDLSPAQRADAVRAHIALVGLEGFEKAHPHQLSGGMSQRVAIARGLVTRPRLLLLDEPFGALDALTRATLQDELARIWAREGITMVLVTHDVEEAVLLADRVVVMAPHPGRVQRIVPIDLPRPRQRHDPRLAALRDTLLREFSHDLVAPATPPDLPTRFADHLFAW